MRGADLLAAAVLAGEEQVDVEPRGLGDHTAGGVGGAQVVPGQDAGVGGAELDHQVLLVVVGHQGNIHVVHSFPAGRPRLSM